jgi:phosphoribosylamine--glycine ligase
MMRLQSDLVEMCLAALKQQLHLCQSNWDPRPALGVVLAAGGYPGTYVKGDVIMGLEQVTEQQCKVFHAGTKTENDQIVTNGGRVLCACAIGNDLQDAQNKAYLVAEKISWQDVYYRTDIGFKALQ